MVHINNPRSGYNAPDFRSPAFLRAHARNTMAFYHPRCVDPAGGFFQFFKDDGTIYDRAARHLVSSARFVFNYATAYRHFGDSAYREAAVHGIEYLRRVHRNPDTGGYAWRLAHDRVVDASNHCYGLAFVLLAYAQAVTADLPGVCAYLDETWDVLEARFWEPVYGLYADEADANWNICPYRGQNANMHGCEALIAAYEATGQARFLERAALLAEHMVNRQAALARGWVWEQCGWDVVHGGVVYGLDPDSGFYDADKYYWVQAEALACAALLAGRTQEMVYWRWYDRLWAYSWRHFVDHRHGAWYRILTRDNRKYDDNKSPAGKTDYHILGACFEVQAQLERDRLA